MKQALARYRDLASRPGLNELPQLPRRPIAVGDEFDGTPKLRKLLVALGNLDSAEANLPDLTLFDAPLGAAVRRFQSRHGLSPDGRIGPRTYAALTTPLGHRVRQIELTLERWRWLAALPRPDIVVNIPQFMLYALPRPNQPAARSLEMPVIVGQSHMRTPVFVAAIEQVIFHPFWDVPASIVCHSRSDRVSRRAVLRRHLRPRPQARAAARTLNGPGVGMLQGETHRAHCIAEQERLVFDR